MPTEIADSITESLQNKLKEIEDSIKFNIGTYNTYVAPVTATTTSTSATITASGGYVPYTTYYAPAPATVEICSPLAKEQEQKFNEIVEKLDQHVDKLEEDIDFLNRKREQDEEQIDELMQIVVQKDVELAKKDKQIEELQTQLDNYTAEFHYLIHQITKRVDCLEEKG